MTTPLWTAAEAEAATGGRVTGDWAVHGISIDTRTLAEGDLFVALKDVRDGHDFVPKACESGAAACLVSKEFADIPALIVEDTLSGLEKLGMAARARTNAFCCAITGSVGKTSVKEMVARIFRAAGPAHWSVKSFNNHWGVPLTLARMPRDTQRAVFEIGMNTPGEIAPRSLMVRPHAALITKIAPAHLEGMGSEDAVALEKSAIFAGLQDGGTIILPHADRYFGFLRDRALAQVPTGRVATFGDGAADAFVTDASGDGVSSAFGISVYGETVRVTIDAVGEHWGQNVAAALLLAVCSGIPAEAAAHALSGYAPPDGRGKAEWLQLGRGEKALLVDDAYNANPESMRAALAGFAIRPARRRLIALGEMKELGPDADALHAGLAPHILACAPETVFLAGDGILPLKLALDSHVKTIWTGKATDLHEKVNKLLTDGDALLIKGSNASGMQSLADALRTRSNEVARRGDDVGAD